MLKVIHVTKKLKPQHIIMLGFLKHGADAENRTRDLTLTKGALYQLSHISG